MITINLKVLFSIYCYIKRHTNKCCTELDGTQAKSHTGRGELVGVHGHDR